MMVMHIIAIVKELLHEEQREPDHPQNYANDDRAGVVCRDAMPYAIRPRDEKNQAE